MRNYNITRNKGEWIYYIWDKEEWFDSVNSQELLANAIEECKKIDKNANRRAIL